MKLRAVVIDDDESCRTFLSKILTQRGCEVISLPDPSACPLYMDPQCLCPHEEACGDVLITDNRMPRMSGLDFVEHQSQRGCKGIARNKLVVSGTWTTAERLRAQRLGCTIMQKPYSLSQMLDWLEERRKSLLPERKLISFEPYKC